MVLSREKFELKNFEKIALVSSILILSTLILINIIKIPAFRAWILWKRISFLLADHRIDSKHCLKIILKTRAIILNVIFQAVKSVFIFKLFTYWLLLSYFLNRFLSFWDFSCNSAMNHLLSIVWLHNFPIHDLRACLIMLIFKHARPELLKIWPLSPNISFL